MNCKTCYRNPRTPQSTTFTRVSFSLTIDHTQARAAVGPLSAQGRHAAHYRVVPAVARDLSSAQEPAGTAAPSCGLPDVISPSRNRSHQRACCPEAGFDPSKATSYKPRAAALYHQQAEWQCQASNCVSSNSQKRCTKPPPGNGDNVRNCPTSLCVSMIDSVIYVLCWNVAVGRGDIGCPQTQALGCAQYCWLQARVKPSELCALGARIESVIFGMPTLVATCRHAPITFQSAGISTV